MRSERDIQASEELAQVIDEYEQASSAYDEEVEEARAKIAEERAKIRAAEAEIARLTVPGSDLRTRRLHLSERASEIGKRVIAEKVEKPTRILAGFLAVGSPDEARPSLHRFMVLRGMIEEEEKVPILYSRGSSDGVFAGSLVSAFADFRMGSNPRDGAHFLLRLSEGVQLVNQGSQREPAYTNGFDNHELSLRFSELSSDYFSGNNVRFVEPSFGSNADSGRLLGGLLVGHEAIKDFFDRFVVSLREVVGKPLPENRCFQMWSLIEGFGIEGLLQPELQERWLEMAAEGITGVLNGTSPRQDSSGRNRLPILRDAYIRLGGSEQAEHDIIMGAIDSIQP